ncbi:MAG: hypothetical protein WC732_09125 [Candidatus Omnitrophota bacterium]
MAEEKRTTMAVDFGRLGFAYCTGDIAEWPPTVTNVVKLPPLEEFNTPTRAVHVAKLLIDELPWVGEYVLEEQPAINRKTELLQSAFAAFATERGARVTSVTPHEIVREFPRLARAGDKKAAAIAESLSLLRGGVRTRPGCNVASKLAGKGRRHDMADALLMLVWYARREHGQLEAAPPKKRSKK